MAERGSIILFDGHCNLCNGTVRFVIRRDPAGRFKFASLQSDAAAGYVVEGEAFETVILIEDGVRYDRSTAALRICRKLKGLWPVLYVFIIVPRGLRDWIYNWIARNRYKWFGYSEECMVPEPGIEERFLEK